MSGFEKPPPPSPTAGKGRVRVRRGDVLKLTRVRRRDLKVGWSADVGEQTFPFTDHVAQVSLMIQFKSKQGERKQ